MDEAEKDYEYDERGNMISLSDPLGNVRTWAYDARGQEISMTDPLAQVNPTGDTVTRGYDDDGRLASILNPNGVLRTFDYGEEGRLVEEVWYAGATDQTAVVDSQARGSEGRDAGWPCVGAGYLVSETIKELCEQHGFRGVRFREVFQG